MKKSLTIIFLALGLLVLSGCVKPQEKQIFKEELNGRIYEDLDNAIISLEKRSAEDRIDEKYIVYSSGKYTVSIINEKDKETRKEYRLTVEDLNYLKSLVSGSGFSSIPIYMEGGRGSECPIYILEVEINKIKSLIRSEDCANSSETFNKIIEAIEKLK
ncbi:hypothetical protein HYX16_05930 [Candidatus Woesearchaeota archaeon]|nr:hypothetical protein [Candidatus Woesearchaeota archaeon]